MRRNSNQDIHEEIVIQIDILCSSLLSPDVYREMVDDNDVEGLCTYVDIFNIRIKVKYILVLLCTALKSYSINTTWMEVCCRSLSIL